MKDNLEFKRDDLIMNMYCMQATRQQMKSNTKNTSVPDNGGGGRGRWIPGRKPYKVSFFTWQMYRKFLMVLCEHWEVDPLEFLVDTMPYKLIWNSESYAHMN